MHAQAAVVVAAAGLLGIAQVSAVPLQTGQTVQGPINAIALGPRPYFLVNDMDEGPLKQKLQSCSEMAMRPTKFSIGHRGGAPLQFPEETRQSILAGTRMGAGVQECDVTFTKDRQLVCRHDQCDLHTTTNIVATELGAKCTTPFRPADNGTGATARCCTSDITLSEFKTLCGKMDGFNASATTPQDFLHGSPPWRTDLYASCGTVLSHADYLELVNGLGLDFTPELKTPAVSMPFQCDYTYDMYRQQMVDEYRAAGIAFSRVWPQSFVFADLAYWKAREPEFGRQAVLLDASGDAPGTLVGAVANLSFYKEQGVQIVAPPLSYLVRLNENNDYIPSDYAVKAKELSLRIITWSLERSPPLSSGGGKDYYYSSVTNGTNNDGDVLKLLDVLAQQVGVDAIFSDWSATVTYYANCMGLFQGPRVP